MSARVTLGIRMTADQLSKLDAVRRFGETRSACARRLLCEAIGAKDEAPRPGRPRKWVRVPVDKAAVLPKVDGVTKCPPAYVAPVQGATRLVALPNYAAREAEAWSENIRERKRGRR